MISVILPVTMLIWFTLWIRFGYDFDTISIRFRYDFDTISIRLQPSPRTGFDVFARFGHVFGLAAELLSEPCFPA